MDIPPSQYFPRGFGALKHPIERFWQKVHKSSGCWFWIGYRNPQGYGQFKPHGRSHAILAHRHSWEMAFGPIPQGLCVLHKCDCPSCVNPAHLFLGTRPDNSADMLRKNRFPLGESHWGHKLTEPDIEGIRRLAKNKITQVKIGRMFGVCRSTISQVLRGRTWCHVK